MWTFAGKIASFAVVVVVGAALAVVTLLVPAEPLDEAAGEGEPR